MSGFLLTTSAALVTSSSRLGAVAVAADLAGAWLTPAGRDLVPPYTDLAFAADPGGLNYADAAADTMKNAQNHNLLVPVEESGSARPAPANPASVAQEDDAVVLRGARGRAVITPPEGTTVEIVPPRDLGCRKLATIVFRHPAAQAALVPRTHLETDRP